MRTHGEGARAFRCPEYRAWAHMIGRCEDPNDSNYYRYGGRGIKVCARWRNSYPAFLKDMGRRPGQGYSIERKENDGDYEPGNCRWATAKEQANNRSSSRILEYRGERLTLAQLAEKYFPNEPMDRVRCRLKARIFKHGLTVEQAVELPIRTVIGQPLLSSAAAP